VGAGSENTIPLSFWIRAAIDNYVCVRCGYIERYIADSNKLKDIQKEWPQVAQTKQR
jgi:Zn ribbon nucleic-acid-binding protein